MGGDSGSHAARQTALLEDAKSTLTDGRDAPDAVFVEESLFAFDWPDGWGLVEEYWLNEPFAHAAVLEHPRTGERRYHVTEPAMDEFASFVREDVTERLRTRLLDERLDPGDDRFEEALAAAIGDDVPIDAGIRTKVRYYLRRDFLRDGEIDPLMADPAIEDISCDGSNLPVYVYHADHGNVETNLAFATEELDSLAVKLAQKAGRHISASRPLVTTTMPDGSRLQVTLGSDVAAHGSNFTIRKFREEPFTPTELVASGTFSVEQMAYLWLAIEHNRSVLYVGPTASGKTTTMNATTLFMPPDAKVVSIEETRELNLPHGDWIADTTRESDLGSDRPEIGMYHLLSEALHQRPTHVLVGEIRTDPEVVRTFFQAIGTGHAGFTTFHARSPEDVLRRLRHDPLSVPDELLTDLDVICVQRMTDIGEEQARKNRSLTELRVGDDGPRLHEVFSYDPRADSFSQVAGSELLLDVADDAGWTRERLETELQDRCRVLSWMVDNDEVDYDAVTERLFRFARTPEQVLADIGGEYDTEPPRIADPGGEAS